MHLNGETMTESEPMAFLPLPHLAFHVLLALADGDRHGWSIIRRIEELTEGVWSPSAGSLYLSMVGLEKKGLISEVAAPEEDTDARRRYYTLSGLGRRVLDLDLKRLASLVIVAADAVRRPGQGG
jgi:DNA-binding PadR family transcriptional regulator